MEEKDYDNLEWASYRNINGKGGIKSIFTYKLRGRRPVTITDTTTGDTITKDEASRDKPVTTKGELSREVSTSYKTYLSQRS